MNQLGGDSIDWLSLLNEPMSVNPFNQRPLASFKHIAKAIHLSIHLEAVLDSVRMQPFLIRRIPKSLSHNWRFQCIFKRNHVGTTSSGNNGLLWPRQMPSLF